jgi:hypothetical protein
MQMQSRIGGAKFRLLSGIAHFNIVYNRFKKAILNRRYSISALLAALILATPFFVYAQTSQSKGLFGMFVELTTGMLAKAALWLAAIALYLISKMINIAAAMLTGIIGVTNFKDVPIVELGWRINLDFVNLLFILILLFIGFATIFRKENYGIKRLLPRLILMALLINFSKVIAGVVLDIGNLLTYFFLNPLQGSEQGLGTLIMKLLNLQKGYDVNMQAMLKSGAATTGDIGTANLMAILGAVGGVVAGMVAMVTIFLYVFTFVLRIIWLWGLVIFAPFAWVANILPNTQKYWRMWWDRFLCWTFVAPLMVFFLYLLAAMGQEAGSYGLIGFTGSIDANATNQIISAANAGANSFLSDWRFLLQYAIVIMFMNAGIVAAKAIGCAGAQGVIGIAEKGGNWVLNSAQRAGRAAAMAPVKYGAHRAAERGAPYAQRAGEWLGRSPLGKLPGMRTLARAGVRAGEKNRGEINNAMKKYSNLSTQALITYSRTQTKKFDKTDSIALATVLAQRRDLADLPDDMRKEARVRMQKALDVGHGINDYEAVKPLLASMPTLGKDAKEIERSVREGVRTGALKNAGPDVFENKDVIKYLNDQGQEVETTRSGLVLQNLYKELGENPQAIQRFGEQLGKKEREAFLAGLQSAFTSGTKAEQFNKINSDFREAYAGLKPENFLVAVTGTKDENGNAVKEVDVPFAKSIAKGMSQQELEKFFTNASQEDIIAFEDARGDTRVEEIDKALKKSGQLKTYTNNLKERLANIDSYDERIKEENIKRASVLATLTGDLSGFNIDNRLIEEKLDNEGLAGEKRDKRKKELGMQKESDVQNYLAQMKKEDAEEFGRKANDFADSRHYIAKYALANDLSSFLKGIKPNDRANVLRDALQNNINKGTKSFKNAMIKDFYIQAIARQNNIDTGKLQREWDEINPEDEALRSLGDTVKWAGKDFGKVNETITGHAERVAGLSDMLKDPKGDKYPTWKEAERMLPGLEKYQQELNGFASDMDKRISDLELRKNDLPEDRREEAQTTIDELTAKLQQIRQTTAAHQGHVNTMRGIYNKPSGGGGSDGGNGGTPPPGAPGSGTPPSGGGSSAGGGGGAPPSEGMPTGGSGSNNPWQDNGFADTEAQAWVDAGFRDANEAKNWKETGFTDPVDAKGWRDNFASATEAQNWHSAMATVPQLNDSNRRRAAAKMFSDKGYSVQNAQDEINKGNWNPEALPLKTSRAPRPTRGPGSNWGRAAEETAPPNTDKFAFSNDRTTEDLPPDSDDVIKVRYIDISDPAGKPIGTIMNDGKRWDIAAQNDTSAQGSEYLKNAIEQMQKNEPPNPRPENQPRGPAPGGSGNPGTGFDAKAELAKIRQAPSSERKQMLADFKQKLAEQKGGFGVMQHEMIRFIRQNPDAPKEELYKQIDDYGQRFSLTEDQKTTAKGIIDEYSKKHEAVRDMRKKYPDDAKLYEATFGVAPKGKVEVVEGPMTLYFKTQNAEDYARIYTAGRREDPNTISPANLQESGVTGGASLNWAPAPELQGTIIAGNASLRTQQNQPSFLRRSARKRYETEEAWAKRIQIHEEQHAIKRLFKDVKSKREDWGIWDDSSPEQQRNILMRSFRSTREIFADSRIKDEIMAYLKSGQDPKETIQYLLKPKGEKGLYDYLEGKKESKIKEEQEFLQEYNHSYDPAMIREVADKVFEEDYHDLITNGVKAFDTLQKSGKSTDEAIGILIHEPLDKWPKTVNRMLDAQKEKAVGDENQPANHTNGFSNLLKNSRSK